MELNCADVLSQLHAAQCPGDRSDGTKVKVGEASSPLHVGCNQFQKESSYYLADLWRKRKIMPGSQLNIFLGSETVEARPVLLLLSCSLQLNPEQIKALSCDRIRQVTFHFSVTCKPRLVSMLG